ncbi:MAG TPA: lytic murein transglycosylase [Capillimicrobium sp.]|nr:lytic murein transglycosylase [Capillimicrobium sp.]
MFRSKLLIGFASVAVVGGLAALPTQSAQADQRTLLVTLSTGESLTVNVDVPPGTPLEQVEIPGVEGTVISVADVTPAPAPAAPAAPQTIPTTPPATQTTPPGTTPSTTPTTPTVTTPTTPRPSTAPQAEDERGPQQEEQTTTTSPAREDGDEQGKRKRKGEADPEGSGRDDAKAKRDRKPPTRDAGGAPTPANPTYTLAEPGAAAIGVPNFFIEKFRIPPFLLPIYQAAGIEYGVRWEVLAAINEIETDYGRNLNVSSAGALGWMQFMPATWRAYGVDANEDGRKDPYNPVDAIFAAARYLKAAGYEDDVRGAIFAYNHADWYVDSVLLRARLIGGLPADFVGSLTGLTQGRFPVHAKATYADDLSEREAQQRIARSQNAAVPVESTEDRRSIDIFAKPGSPVIAVQDGEIIAMGRRPGLGRYVKLRDAYGNTYTYGHLKKLATEYPVPKPKDVSQQQVADELQLPEDPKPTAPASAGRQLEDESAGKERGVRAHRRGTAPEKRIVKERLFANPGRPNAFDHGGRDQILDAGGSVPGLTTFNAYFSSIYGLKADDVVLKRLRVGSEVIQGTILGRLGKLRDGEASHTTFAIRPAGRGAPKIDPKPILDGWKLLESTAIYRAEGRNALLDDEASEASIGQILLMSKEALTRRVLDNPRIEVYECGRRDIAAGLIDRRVLAALEFLAASGLRPTVTSLECGHSYLTASGNVSQHSVGSAVDIAMINGIPILGHQGEGSITDITVRRLLTLQGTMKPDQIITLMTYPGTDNTLALPDHDDHIHVGWAPLTGPAAQKFESVLEPEQWDALIERLSTLENPTVSLEPSKYALKVPAPSGDRASSAHEAE